jgi:hypothetical protein
MELALEIFLGGLQFLAIVLAALFGITGFVFVLTLWYVYIVSPMIDWIDKKG